MTASRRWGRAERAWRRAARSWRRIADAARFARRRGAHTTPARQRPPLPPARARTRAQGISSAARVAASAVGKAAEAAKDIAEDLTSFRALQDYTLAGHVATAGPCGAWRVFNAVSKKPGAARRRGCRMLAGCAAAGCSACWS